MLHSIKHFSLFFVLLFALLPFMAQSQHLEAQLSDSAFASVLTCGAGDEFYTSFGHSAIRVCDTTIGIDVVYNYGTFNFNIPHFYWTFACGNLDYCLSRDSYSNFLSDYAFERRAVWEQRLLLSNQELNNLFVLLETNYLPQYRYYRYDFFRDNCATRIRDILSSSLAHRVLFVDTIMPQALTYRQLLAQATGNELMWWQFGIDLLLGQRCDKQCSNLEYMFSPFEMMTQLDTTHLQGTNSLIVAPPQQLLEDRREPLSPSFSPTLLFWIVFVVVLLLTLVAWRYNWSLAVLDIPLFVVAGIVSLTIIFLWFFTSHYCTAFNWNLLWASPLYILFAIRLRRSNKYFILFQLLLLLAVLTMTIIGEPQSFNAAIFPIVLTYALRLISYLKR